MHFTCFVSDMVTALNIVTRAIAARSTIQVMEGVLFTSCDEGLRLTCTDLALGIETHIAAEIKEEGNAVLPGKLLAEFVKKLPEGTMDVKVNEKNVATIRCAGSRSTLTGFPGEEYPALPDVGEAQTIELSRATLKEMIQRTSFAIATDETRPILTGCLIETKDAELIMVAVDGFRLALRRESFDSPLSPLSVVVPGKILNEMARILDDSDETVILNWGKTHLLADIGPTRVVARLLDGEFIRYQQILPSDWLTRVVVPKKDLEASIDRASLMAREGKNNLVRLHVEDGRLLISSNAEMGDVNEEIAIQFEGRDLDIAFNVRYLTDTLRAIEDENIALCFNSNVSPCVLKPTFGDRYLYLALPVRVFTS